ncbi:MAG: hypothetical protein HY761_09855 [Candidatus Omnitrophica bacterium]|nr:hypothetical protein [Candidatus Omnitrophota bacterium]
MKKTVLLLMLILSGCVTPQYRGYQGPIYNENFTTLQKINGISITLVPIGSAWTVIIQNNTDNMVKFLLDESSYVTTEGITQRLIRGQAKKIHSDMQQPFMPIPPKSKFAEVLIPERIADNTAWMIPPKPSNLEKSGKLYFTLESNGIKNIWIEEIKFTEVKCPTVP